METKRGQDEMEPAAKSAGVEAASLSHTRVRMGHRVSGSSGKSGPEAWPEASKVTKKAKVAPGKEDAKEVQEATTGTVQAAKSGTGQEAKSGTVQAAKSAGGLAAKSCTIQGAKSSGGQAAKKVQDAMSGGGQVAKSGSCQAAKSARGQAVKSDDGLASKPEAC